VIQAYKWYQKAASLGQQEAVARLENLQQWASDEAEAGNPHARQLLLNFQ
jgi:TPR repeat protein